jgi:prevent-host-death family protein
MARRKHAWPVAKAKAQFSALIDRALEEGPQTITRNGRKAVVVIAADQWETRGKREGTLADFLAKSPLRGARLRIPSRKSVRFKEIEL